MITKLWVLPLALLAACQTMTSSEHEHVLSWPVASVEAHAPSGIVGVDVNSRDEVHLFHRGGVSGIKIHLLPR